MLNLLSPFLFFLNNKINKNRPTNETLYLSTRIEPVSLLHQEMCRYQFGQGRRSWKSEVWITCITKRTYLVARLFRIKISYYKFFYFLMKTLQVCHSWVDDKTLSFFNISIIQSCPRVSLTVLQLIYMWIWEGTRWSNG